MYLAYLCIFLRTSQGTRCTEEMLAKCLKAKPLATSPDWRKVEIPKKRMEAMGYVMCYMNFTALMEKLGMH